MVFITVQNLVLIALVVLIILKAVFGVKIGENEKFLNCYPFKNAITHHLKQTT